MSRGNGSSNGGNSYSAGNSNNSSSGLKQINLDEIWADLESGIQSILNSDQNIVIKRYMQLYT